MTIQCGDIYAPYWATYQSGGPSIGSQLIDDEAEKVSYVVTVHTTGKPNTFYRVRSFAEDVQGNRSATKTITVRSEGTGTPK